MTNMVTHAHLPEIEAILAPGGLTAANLDALEARGASVLRSAVVQALASRDAARGMFNPPPLDAATAAAAASSDKMVVEIATGFMCESCDKFSTDPAEFPPLWECSRESCGETHVGERACESCNSPATRKLAERACDECDEEVQEVQVALCPSCHELLKCDGCDELVKP